MFGAKEPANEPLLDEMPPVKTIHEKKKAEADSVFATREGAWTTLQGYQDGEIAFFKHLSIAQDGGMSEIGVKADLWYNGRYFSSVLLVVFVIYNAHFLIKADVHEVTRVNHSIDYKEFLLSTAIFSTVGLPVQRPEKIVSLVELSILMCLLAKTLYHIGCGICGSGFTRWRGIAALCWIDLPDLSVFSAIKLLQFVTPQQLSYDLNYILWYEPEKTKTAKGIWFIISRPFLLMFGLDCFLIKVRQANEYIMSDEVDFDCVMGSVILLNQILGVVQIAKTIKNRLYRFIFAGEDGIMTDEEQIRQDVWEAMTAHKVWQKYPPHMAVSLLLSWCDDDFQMMTLNEK